jgi:HEAT repeat protein
MVVDPRRDHSFRVPRPDLSVALGVPNACTGCHDDRPAAWAAARSPRGMVRTARGRRIMPRRSRRADAAQRDRRADLAALAGDPAHPAIVRATALAALGRAPGPAGLAAIVDGLAAEDALIRLAAVDGLEALHPRDRLRLAFPLLDDPVRAVRLAAARVLAPVPPDALPPPQAGSWSTRSRPMSAPVARPPTGRSR